MQNSQACPKTSHGRRAAFRSNKTATGGNDQCGGLNGRSRCSVCMCGIDRLWRVRPVRRLRRLVLLRGSLPTPLRENPPRTPCRGSPVPEFGERLAECLAAPLALRSVQAPRVGSRTSFEGEEFNSNWPRIASLFVVW